MFDVFGSFIRVYSLLFVQCMQYTVCRCLLFSVYLCFLATNRIAMYYRPLLCAGARLPVDAMFLKPFHIKSNAQLKASERKKLRARLITAFSELQDASCLDELIPSKAAVVSMRIITHSGVGVTCFSCDRQPLFVELDDGALLPTLYSLWRAPRLLAAFTTHRTVVARLQGGAHLMLPGVHAQAGVPPHLAYGRLSQGSVVAVNTEENAAAVAVGRTARSSHDMYLAGGRGKCVLLVHVLGDLLWKEGSRCARPSLSAPAVASTLAVGETEAAQEQDEHEAGQEPTCNAADENPGGNLLSAAGCVGKQMEQLVEQMADVLNPSDMSASSEAGPQNHIITTTPSSAVGSEQAVPDVPVDMDQLLYDAFRRALKLGVKKLHFPVLVSSFYAQHMQSCSAQPLDVKKSSHKKISRFLDQMQKDGIVEVKELTKGVQSIVSVNFEHPEITRFKATQVMKPVVPEENTTSSAENPRFHSGKFEKIEDVFFVNANVAALFKLLGVEKSTHLAAGRVRDLLTSYVKKHQLQSAFNKCMVRLDRVLSVALTGRDSGEREELSWTQLHQLCLQRMSPGHVLSLAGETPQVRRGRAPCVELTTATRSGNKKVTLVLNAAAFGIDPAELAHKCQLGVAASSSVTAAPHRPAGTQQVMVQGNQVRFLGKLLQQHYGLPCRCITGLELAVKK